MSPFDCVTVLQIPDVVCSSCAYVRYFISWLLSTMWCHWFLSEYYFDLKLDYNFICFLFFFYTIRLFSLRPFLFFFVIFPSFFLLHLSLRLRAGNEELLFVTYLGRTVLSPPRALGSRNLRTNTPLDLGRLPPLRSHFTSVFSHRSVGCRPGRFYPHLLPVSCWTVLRRPCSHLCNWRSPIARDFKVCVLITVGSHGETFKIRHRTSCKGLNSCFTRHHVFTIL